METKELLRALGLLAYEAEVYEALLRFDRAKVQDIARVCTVPRPQIYVALAALAKRGLCRETRGKVNYYSAIPPGVAFKGILRQEEQMLKAKVEGIRKLEENHLKIDKEDAPSDFVQVVKGPHVRHFIDDLIGKAKEEVLIFLKSAHEQSEKSLEGGARAELSMLQRGVRVQCLYEAAALEDPRVIPVLERVVAQGEEGRVVPAVPMNMMIFDDRVAMFSLSTQQGGATVFVFTHPDLITVMKSSFQNYWEKGPSLSDVLREKQSDVSAAQPARTPEI